MIRPLQNRWVWTVLALLLILIGLRVALPGWVVGYLNGKLDRMGEYHGRLESVNLHLWRGAYSINGLRIIKRGKQVEVPFFDAPRIDLSVSWHALWHGGVVASIDFLRPVLNFVDSRDEMVQAGTGVDWRKRLEDLVPIRLDEVNVHQGMVHFRNFSTVPKVDLQATRLEVRILNLTNVRDARTRPADLTLTAQVLGRAPLESRVQFDPFGSLDDFHFTMKLSQIELKRLNEFLRAYAKLDVASGSGEFIMELEAQNGQLNGYAKPLLHNVQVFSWKQDVENQGENPLRTLWEAVAGGIENLFKNQQKEQFATRVEIHGRIDDARTSTWQAIVAVLHNAFVEAYRARFEGLPARGRRDGVGENGPDKAGG